MQAQPTAHRTCTRCSQSKPVTEFYTHHRDGYQARCKVCDAADRRERRARYDQAARDRERYASEPEFRNRRIEREAARRAAGVPCTWLTAKLREQLLKQSDLCGICGTQVAPDEASIDHIVAVSEGGTHDLANLQLAHHVCNSIKGVRALDDVNVDTAVLGGPL